MREHFLISYCYTKKEGGVLREPLENKKADENQDHY